MTKLLELNTSLFLVAVGHVTARQLADPYLAGCYPAQGLLLQQSTASGRMVELFVAAPSDLHAWADLSAVPLLKPVVLPLVLGEVRPGRINAELRSDAAVHRLARHILAGLPALRDPALSAGVTPQKGP